jgi:NAD-dependent DNA ligase
MQFNNPYWSVKQKIEMLEKWLIIHSILYYELNTNIVSDYTFDMNARQLLEYKKQYPDIFKQSKWYYIFKDFKTSGFYIFKKLKREEQMNLLNEAQYLLNMYNNK